MATDLATIYSWFQTGDFPTQQQFQATFSSFYHKDENIPLEKVEGLAEKLQQTLTTEELENHIEDEAAHQNFLAQKNAGNIDEENAQSWRNVLEVPDADNFLDKDTFLDEEGRILPEMLGEDFVPLGGTNQLEGDFEFANGKMKFGTGNYPGEIYIDSRDDENWIGSYFSLGANIEEGFYVNHFNEANPSQTYRTSFSVITTGFQMIYDFNSNIQIVFLDQDGFYSNKTQTLSSPHHFVQKAHLDNANFIKRYGDDDLGGEFWFANMGMGFGQNSMSPGGFIYISSNSEEADNIIDFRVNNDDGFQFMYLDIAKDIQLNIVAKSDIFSMTFGGDGIEFRPNDLKGTFYFPPVSNNSYVQKKYVDDQVAAAAAKAFKTKASVASFANLPSAGNLEGDVRNVLDTGNNYVWVADLNNTGVAGWDDLGGLVDLSDYYSSDQVDAIAEAAENNAIAEAENYTNGLFPRTSPAGKYYIFKADGSTNFEYRNLDLLLGDIIYVKNYAGANFGEKLQNAITSAKDGQIIDARDTSLDHVAAGVHDISTSINITKPLSIYLPRTEIQYLGSGNMFNIQSSNVRIFGTGRSSREDLKLITTTLNYVNGAEANWYHFYSRGNNVIEIRDMDILGVRTTNYDAQQGNASKPLNGAGGIYFEKPNPGTTTGGNTCSNITLENLLILRTKAHAVYIDTPISGTITNVRISQGGGHGIFLNGGTTTRIDNCYVSSTHKAGFMLYAHTAATLINCSAEYSGIGYWLRGSFNINLIGCYAEKCGNRSANVPNTNITTLAQDGTTVVTISDVGSDNVALFRGSSYVVTGGDSINLDLCTSSNAGQPTGVGSTVNSRDFLVRGNARSVNIRNPKTNLASGEVYYGRFNIAFEAFGGQSPQRCSLIYDVYNAGTVVPEIAGRYISYNSSAGNAAPVFIDSTADVFIQVGKSFVDGISYFNSTNGKKTTITSNATEDRTVTLQDNNGELAFTTQDIIIDQNNVIITPHHKDCWITLKENAQTAMDTLTLSAMSVGQKIRVSNLTSFSAEFYGGAGRFTMEPDTHILLYKNGDGDTIKRFF